MGFVATRGLFEIIYGAVGEPDYWRRVAGALSETIEDGVVQISAYGARADDVCFYAVPEFIPAKMADQYTQQYMAQDPRMEVNHRAIGRVTACHEFVDVEDFERTDLVNDFLDHKEVDLRWCAAHVEKPDPDITMLVSFMRPRRRGPFERQETRRIERLSRHVHRAGRLHFDLARASLAATRLETALDLLDEAVFVCRRDGRIRHMNAAAVRMIEGGAPLGAGRGRLRPARAEDADGFARALAAAADPFAAGTAPASFALRGPAGTLPLLARLHTLPRSLGLDGPARGEVLIVVRDPNLPARHEECALRALGFSPAETALTRALADGRTLAEHAADRGVTLETVRSQLKSAMAKVGVSRQTDLVRLALRYAG